MIETKEQYERLKAEAQNLGYIALEGTGVHIIETIEALRRFVRAHDKVDAARIGALTMDLNEYNALVQEFTAARAALPDWLTNG